MVTEEEEGEEDDNEATTANDVPSPGGDSCAAEMMSWPGRPDDDGWLASTKRRRTCKYGKRLLRTNPS